MKLAMYYRTWMGDINFCLYLLRKQHDQYYKLFDANGMRGNKVFSSKKNTITVSSAGLSAKVLNMGSAASPQIQLIGNGAKNNYDGNVLPLHHR